MIYEWIVNFEFLEFDIEGGCRKIKSAPTLVNASDEWEAIFIATDKFDFACNFRAEKRKKIED